MTSEHEISFRKNDKGSYLIPKDWRIGEFNIGNDYTDEEIANFLNGVKPLPEGKIILTIGSMYQNIVADGDLYPTGEIDDNDITVTLSTSSNLTDDVEINKADEELKSEITSIDFDYIYRYVIGNNLTIDGSWVIDGDSDIILVEQIIDLTKNDIGLEKSILNVGSWVIGNDYTDEEIEQAQKGQLSITKDIVFIDYKYGKDLIVGERYPTMEIDDNDITIKTEYSNNITDDVEINKADEELNSEIIYSDFDYIYRSVIGHNLTIDGNWDIDVDSDSDIISIEQTINLTKNDIGLEKSILNVGSWVIGNDYTDDEIEQAQKGQLNLIEDIVFVGYKYGKNLIFGERYPVINITEDLTFDIIRVP